MDDDIRLSDPTVGDMLRDTLRQHEETWTDALREKFLMDAMIGLFKARQRAEMTQEQVAKAMGTTQSAVARWEKNFEGKISLHRLADFALACEMVPTIHFENMAVAKQRLEVFLNLRGNLGVISFPGADEVFGTSESPSSFGSTTIKNNTADINLAG